VAFSVWAAALFWRGLQTRSWPSVEGTIFRSWVLQRGANVGRDSASTRASRARYFAEVEYDYIVSGKEIRGSRIAVGKVHSMTRSAVEAQVAKWPANAKVRVYYNPSDPSACVLIAGPNWRAVLFSAFPGAFFLGISLFLFSKFAGA
jgi:hypothetical protein